VLDLCCGTGLAAILVARGMDLTILLPDGERWERRDLTFMERAYAAGEIVIALGAAGFVDVVVSDAAADLGLPETGRSFFTCFKHTSPR
jgi:predicted RNA methylase